VQKQKEKQKTKDQTAAAEAEREAGRRALRRGQAGVALVHLENALKVYGQGGDKFGEAATHDLLGQLYEQQGRYGLALEHFRAALKIYTEPHAKHSEYDANLMHAKIGNMYYRQGDLEGARGAYNRMNVKKPGNKAKGLAGILAGAAAGALSDDRSVQIGAPTVGSALSAKEIFDRYRRAIIYAGYEIGLGRVDYRAGDLKSAKEHFDDALSATKDNLPGIGNLGQTRRFCRCAHQFGDVALKPGALEATSTSSRTPPRGQKRSGRFDVARAKRTGA
jgi:tetratricopeptide (TPR) repeat protein